MGADFLQIGLQIDQLVFELLAVIGQDGEEFFQLWGGVAWAVVGVDDFLGLGQRQAQALGAQRQLEPGAVARAVDAVAPASALAPARRVARSAGFELEACATAR